MPIFLHPSWILGSGSGHRTPASTVLVPRTVEIVPHSIPFFVLAGTDLALLAIVPCSELMIRWFSSWPQILFPKFSTSPSRAPWKCNLPVLFPDRSFHIQPPQNTSHLTRSSIFSLYQWLSPNCCLSCEEFHLWPLIIAKMGNSKKTKTQGMYLLDEGPHLQSDLDAPLNSVSVYLMCDIIDFITFCFVIQDVLSHMQ